MSKPISMEELEKSLASIGSIFKIDDILRENITDDFIKAYYKNHHEHSNVGYNFQSKEDYVHTPLSFDGEFDEKGYYAQPKFIHGFIGQNRPIRDVIELGCGKGFNSKYLAELNRDISFLGIDLTPEFIQHANDKHKKTSNLNFKLGDFHHLPMKNKNYDLVFEVEAVCHAKEVREVLQEVYRVLRPGGFYVAFDGFKQRGFDALDHRLILASKISDITMGVGNGQKIDEFIKVANEVGFEVIKQDDITHAIIPSLRRFHGLSRKYFKSKFLAKLFLKPLSSHVMKNAIAGILMPFMVDGKALGYYQIVLQKNK